MQSAAPPPGHRGVDGNIKSQAVPSGPHRGQKDKDSLSVNCVGGQEEHLLSHLSSLTLCLSPFPPPAVCDSGAHAGADVQTQDVQPQPQGLPQDLPLPEMAEDGGTTR